jgi:hypothetical protein
MSQAFDLAKFISDRKDIIDKLYAEGDVEIKSFDDLLKLPVNEEYAKMQSKKEQSIRQTELDFKSMNIKNI